jgi:hypothetical protein
MRSSQWPQGVRVAKVAAVPEGRQQRLDHDVLGGRAVAEDEVGHTVDVATVALEQLVEHLGAASAERLDRHPHLLGRWRSTGLRT